MNLIPALYGYVPRRRGVRFRLSGKGDLKRLKVALGGWCLLPEVFFMLSVLSRMIDIAMMTVPRGTGEATTGGGRRRPRRAVIAGCRLYQAPT